MGHDPPDPGEWILQLRTFAIYFMDTHLLTNFETHIGDILVAVTEIVR